MTASTYAAVCVVLPDGIHYAGGGAVTLCGKTRWTTGDVAADDAIVTCHACLTIKKEHR